MILKSKYFSPVITSFFFASIACSCRKEQPACNGNCVNVTISGIVDIKTTGAGMANVPVEVNWFKKGFCIGCTSYKVASGKSGSDGKFSFNTNIDTSLFKDYFLSVRVPADTNYISGSAIGGQDFNELRFYDSATLLLQNLKFNFYPKAYLTINLHHTLSDSFNYFSVEHSFADKWQYVDYIISGSRFASNTTLKVETSSDIYTRITWTKVFDVGKSTVLTDSIIAKKNGINVFDINY